ncbi:MAG: hypothetical protein LBJ20_04255 [Candidatus Methanoplasma sp.]|jgi:hypothetical protein|nr:hypothetical protein [Candidatus Methanoplasma sp.]
MSQNRCPFCGERIQRNNLTCPRCFREIPREPQAGCSRITTDNVQKKYPEKSLGIALFLAAAPAFAGILGLGMIYLNPRERRGYWFLAAGLALFLPIIILFFTMRDSGLLSAMLLLAAIAVILLLYASAAVAAFIETVFGSVFKILRF